MAFRTDHALLDPAAFLGGELEQTDPLGHAVYFVKSVFRV